MFRQIGHDERVHKQESLAQMKAARFVAVHLQRRSPVWGPHLMR
jgi:hypothetical protein